MTPQQHTQLLRELADLHKKVCIELSASLSAKGFDRIKELELRARAAAEEIEGRKVPSDEEIIEFWSWHCAGDGDSGIIKLARFGGGEVGK